MATFDVWCQVIDSDNQPFGSPISVPVSDTTFIADLKEKIKDQAKPALDHVAALELIVWKLCQPQELTPDFLPNVKLIDKAPEDHTTQDRYTAFQLSSLSQICDNNPWPKSKVHVLVQFPYIRGNRANRRKHDGEADTANKRQKFNEERERDVEKARMALAPSSAARMPAFMTEQKKRPVLNGRPLRNHGPPVGLFHPVFNTFRAAMITEPFYSDSRTYLLVMELFNTFAEIYDTKSRRIEAIDQCLEELLGRSFITVESEGVKSDGVIQQPCGLSSAYVVIRQVKNEIGTESADPYNEACLFYRKYWTSQHQLMKRSYCPSILLAIAGPWLCVAGAVYVDKVIVQPLTDYVWLGGDNFQEDHLRSAARLFTALKSVISSLEDYYMSLGQRMSTPDPVPPLNGFPFVTKYGPEEKKFTYLSLLDSESQNKFMYKAFFDSDPNKKLVVKFTSRYNAKAHRLLSEHKLAPTLHYSSTDDDSSVMYGGRHMIVMDYVPMKSSSSVGLLSSEQYDKIRKSIELLHQHNFTCVASANSV
ncbi:hypothetical protein H0H93_012907 [Arthromyces matolae]|nr:hypothetical protein H0H93_012907 [Arthromyces matolae]